jgi:hypothetical protein
LDFKGKFCEEIVSKWYLLFYKDGDS